MDLLPINGVDISHRRLVELTRLADQAKPFYDWVEIRFQESLSTEQPLDGILNTASKSQIEEAIRACYDKGLGVDLPILFDGIGRSYPHGQACYYFFSWLIRDAPKQRLEPLIQRIMKNTSRKRSEVEIDVLSALVYKYRSNVKTFSWLAVREVIVDRLEGSRRAIKGHEKETIVRTALLVAIQSLFAASGSYGVYAKVETAATQLMINNESFDVSVTLLDTDGKLVRRILVPIKTRETEGGGHSHLFTRDIMSAINSIKSHDTNDFLIVVIVARNWSAREAQEIAEKVDHLVLFDISPSEFTIFSEEKQQALNAFVGEVLSGKIVPKRNG